jgi:hypothetical protein
MKGFALHFGTLLFTCGLLAAQQPAPVPKDPGLVLRVTTRLVLVDAVILDKESHPIPGLKSDDFTITEDGSVSASHFSPSAILSARMRHCPRSFLRT